MAKENNEKQDSFSTFALFPDAVLVIGNRGRICISTMRRPTCFC
jgi:hypothetical protein